MDFCTALENDPFIIRLAVAVAKSVEEFLGVGESRIQFQWELVRDGKQQYDQCLLIVGFDLKDIQTDTFSLYGFVQQSVLPGFIEGGVNSFFGKSFEFNVHDASLVLRKEQIGIKFVTDQKKVKGAER
jgi:hypothetical protein